MDSSKNIVMSLPPDMVKMWFFHSFEAPSSKEQLLVTVSYSLEGLISAL